MKIIFTIIIYTSTPFIIMEAKSHSSLDRIVQEGPDFKLRVDWSKVESSENIPEEVINELLQRGILSYQPYSGHYLLMGRNQEILSGDARLENISLPSPPLPHPMDLPNGRRTLPDHSE